MQAFINDEALINKGYVISTEKGLLNFDLIFDYLDKESYWSQGIAPERLKKAIENSLCFGIYKDGQQAGFARVVTDSATFAYICDVFVLQPYRGNDLSKWLMQTIVRHPDLQGLRRWSLATADAHDLYKKFGFVPVSKPGNWMEIFKPYQQQKEEEKS